SICTTPQQWCVSRCTKASCSSSYPDQHRLSARQVCGCHGQMDVFHSLTGCAVFPYGLRQTLKPLPPACPIGHLSWGGKCPIAVMVGNTAQAYNAFAQDRGEREKSRWRSPISRCTAR